MFSFRKINTFILISTVLVSPVVAADAYPDKPVRMIISFTAGGSTDLLGREYARRLEQRLGQSVVIENKPGANGNIGTQYVSKSTPDGYTLLIGNMGPIAVNPALMPDFNLDARTDLTSISPFVAAPNVLVVGNDVPATTFEEFREWVKSQPKDSITYGSTGVGTAAHLSSYALSQKLGVPMLHVPYKGSGGLVDIVAGRVHFTMATAPSVLNLIESGKLRALLLTGDKRLPALPDVPSASEYGMGDSLISAWYGIFGPPDLPENVTTRINKETYDMLSNPEFVEKIGSMGAVTAKPATPEQYASFVASELVRMKNTVEALNATVQ